MALHISEPVIVWLCAAGFMAAAIINIWVDLAYV